MNKILLSLIILVLVSCKSKESETITTPRPILNNENYNVAFLLIDGVYNTELTAPYDIFHHTIFRDSIKAMNVFTVSNQSKYVTTFEGLKIIPDYNFLTDSFPNIDILVVPAAEHSLDTDLESKVLLNFVKQTSKSASYVTSHCDGAFVLAKSGVLNGIESTTYPSDIKHYKEMFPELVVHDSVIFVHDGKFITSAGGAKAFEASLYLCEILYGKKVANELAKGLVINWDLKSVPHIVVNR